MSEPGFNRAIVFSEDFRHVGAFVERLKTQEGYKIPIDPASNVPDYYSTVSGNDGSIDGPTRTTLSKLRREGLPPVRLKWTPHQRLSIASLTHYADGSNCGKCTARDLRKIVEQGEAGFAGQFKWVSAHEYPDLYFVCSFIAPESWLVGWHLLKAGKTSQGGAWQRPNVRHNARYASIAERWTGFSPGGDTLLSDFDFEYEPQF